MAEITIDDLKLKQLLKTAIVELLQEQKEIVYELLREIVEDIALEKAIQEGENTEPVSSSFG
jgi:Arc/MetJ family transcription regulator